MYLKNGDRDKAEHLASELPHKRECREVILPLVQGELTEKEMEENIRKIILGE